MTKEELRRRMPVVAAIVDEYRALMENGGKVIYASENGHVIDRREPVNPESVWVIPPDFRPYTPTTTKEKK